LAEFDVLIAGAGPAGCAAAISLAEFAPELTTCLVGIPPDNDPLIGETVPPPIKPILDHLGLWSAFAADGHCASYRTFSAWGTPRLISNEFLFQTHQVGWRLNRGRFDAMMQEAAKARANHVCGKVVKLIFKGSCWHVNIGDGTTHTARAIIDATGRAAALARLCGLRPKRFDRLVGSFLFFDDATASDEGLIIEAVRDGWWYTALLPTGRRIVAFMTDTDLARRLGIGQRDRWLRAMHETAHVAAAASQGLPLGAPRLQGAGSQLVTGNIPELLLSIGDAASCFDPISGQGIFKALRSGIFVSYAVADFLRRRETAGLRRHQAIAEAEFAAYRRTFHDYYKSERRWPTSVFWRRRHQHPMPTAE
jgi:2-polyprenyl-6-methoxyphenol hydroxylase-like FAD-dependent oxidoreductase